MNCSITGITAGLVALARSRRDFAVTVVPLLAAMATAAAAVPVALLVPLAAARDLRASPHRG